MPVAVFLGYMAHRTVQSFILLGVALLAACGSEPTSTICTREDIGSACSAPSIVEFDRESEFWHVTLRTAVTDRVEYEDGGVLCVLTETRCIEEECNFFGGNIATANDALNRCRESFGR